MHVMFMEPHSQKKALESIFFVKEHEQAVQIAKTLAPELTAEDHQCLAAYFIVEILRCRRAVLEERIIDGS